MALNVVAHDGSLQGDGNPSSSIGLTDRGFILIDEPIFRTCYHSIVPLATSPGGVVELRIPDLNPNDVEPHEYMTVTDDDGYMGTITEVDTGNHMVKCRTYYIPPTHAQAPYGFTWANIDGEITDNQSFMEFMGDKSVFQSTGNNYVNALNAIEALIGLTDGEVHT